MQFIAIDRTLTGVPGAYLVRHVKTGCVYIGSSGCLYSRYHNHQSQLRRGLHPNHHLQALYNEDPRVEYAVFVTDTREEAHDQEQDLLDDWFANSRDLTLNIGIDVRSVNKGRSMSDQAREKLRQYRYANPTTRETIEKIRLANTGKKRTPEFSERMSQLHLGRAKSPEWLANNKAAQPKKRVSAEGVVYESYADAARAHGFPVAGVAYRINHPRFPDWKAL